MQGAWSRTCRPSGFLSPRTLRMLRALMWLFLASLPVWSASSVAAATCVAVEGPVEVSALARAALSERGIVAPTGSCVPATLSLVPEPEGAVLWSVVLPHGTAMERSLSSVERGAAWVDSVVRPERLAELFTTRVELSADAPDGARLYASFEAWRAGIPSAIVDRELIKKPVDKGLLADPGLEAMWALDRGRKEARGEGAVFAIEVDDAVYIHDGSPLAWRGKPFGRLAVYGDRGLFEREVCYWVPARSETEPGYVDCDVEVRMLDLQSGAVTTLDKRGVLALLADQPERLAAFRAERPKHAGVVWRYANEALQSSTSGDR